jgi:hypothetical protein
VVRTLLRDPAGDAFDMAGLNGKDKLFLTATCSAQVIAEVIWISAHYDKDEALEGLEALAEDIRNVIKKKAGAWPATWRPSKKLPTASTARCRRPWWG